MDTVSHEICHALTDGKEKEVHGELWAHEARCLGGWYKTADNRPSDEFHEYCDRREASPSCVDTDNLINKVIATTILEETKARGTTHYVGRLRLDFILTKSEKEQYNV